MDAPESNRKLGLFRATLVGVGAIVGGGVLALAGTAFASAGLAAILAFVLNGVIAFATARSFAVMTRAYPQSGGSYVFAKMILSVRAAFAVGWMVWFAGIVAGVLYALGFAVYALIIAREAFAVAGAKSPPPGLPTTRPCSRWPGVPCAFTRCCCCAARPAAARLNRWARS